MNYTTPCIPKHCGIVRHQKALGVAEFAARKMEEAGAVIICINGFEGYDIAEDLQWQAAQVTFKPSARHRLARQYDVRGTKQYPLNRKAGNSIFDRFMEDWRQ